MKYAAYPDQAGDDFVEGCRTLSKLGIDSVVLRNYDNQPILQCTDAACQECLKILIDFKLKVVAIAGDPGNRHPAYVANDRDKVKRSALLANYFNADYVRIWPGKCYRQIDRDWPKLHGFMLETAEFLATAGIKWFVEPNYSSAMSLKACRRLMYEHLPKCRYSYDPVAMSLGQKIDVLEFYNELADNISFIDLRDMVLGFGMCPVGQGDMLWKDILPKLINKDIVAVFDPSLGYRFKTAQGKVDTFKYAYDGYQALLESLT